jgi:hypothetical protein
MAPTPIDTPAHPIHEGADTENECSQERTALQTKVSHLADALEESLNKAKVPLDLSLQILDISDNESIESRFSESKTLINVINGVLEGKSSGTTLEQMGDEYIDALIRYTTGRKIEEDEKFLSARTRKTLKASSTLTEEMRQKIGLMRAPGLDESLFPNFNYNLSMCSEALILGQHLRNECKAGNQPSFPTLWEACRAWRVSSLDLESNTEDIDNFSSSRLWHNHSHIFSTSIHAFDIKYGHLIGVTTKHIQRATRVMPSHQQIQFRELELSDQFWKDKIVQLVSLQHFVIIQEQRIPLTTLRTVLNERDQAVPHPWSHIDNKNRKIDSKKLVKVPPNELSDGVLLHTEAKYLDLLSEEIESKLQRVLKLFVSDSSCIREQSELLTRLAEIHYLLAHAAFDCRGSAAKSELLIRTLAIASGVELSPFKKGFIPDLEAFVHPKGDYINLYLHAFD